MSDERKPKQMDDEAGIEPLESVSEATTRVHDEAETLPPVSRGAETGAVEAMPERFGRYRIVKELGRGAMGAVYLAEDTELRRQVAVKIPKFAQQEQSELLERFYREARSAATLNHTNICQVHDIGEHEGTRYITMAYVSGPPLSKLVGTPKLRSERIIAKLVRKIAVGLAAAHSKGILHRDLKPSNILLDERNEPVITDFGLARQVEQDADSRLTQDGTLLGTPAYMSPEQVSGDPDRMGPASDVYSLGVILYELLTGKLPYKGRIMAVIGQIIEGKPKPPPELRSDLDKRMEAICLKMMARSVENRYSSAAEAATALSHYLEQTSTQSQTISPQAGGAQAKLAEHKQHTIELLKQGKFNEAAERLQKLAGVGGAGAEPYSQWATAELARLKTMPKEAFEKGAGLVAETIRLLAQQDYARVIELLKGVPQEYRSAEAAQLLKQAQELKAEADQLNERVKEAVRDGQYDGLRENVLDRLLELEPGNLMARDIYEHLGTYGPGEKLRFAKDGMLLPARGKYWWLDHLARLISQRATQRRVQHAKAGGRRKGEPARADEARSEVPVVPIAIGLGILGVVALLLLAVVLILRTPKGTIVIEIGVPNAVVSVDDGKLQFTTTEDDQSIEIELKKGEHTITVTKDGYEPFTRQLRVRKGQTETIQIDLASASIQETGEMASGGTVAGSGTRSSSTRPPVTAKPILAKTPVKITEASPLETGFVSLFDGKTLSGWHTNGVGRWTVENGAIVGRLPKAKKTFGHLVFDAEYGDFILNLKFKLKGDSGVYVRGQEAAPDGMVGLQANLVTPNTIGSIVDVLEHPISSGQRVANPVDRVKEYFREDGWNDLRIEALGQQISVSVNGVKTAELVNYAGRSEGRIALQMFGYLDTEVMFKDIRIRPLTNQQESQLEPGFVSLFDGKTLNGWRGDPSVWRVENGAVVGEAPTGVHTFLSTERAFGNFVLKMKVKCDQHNTGINVRSQRGGGYVVSGPQADIAGGGRGLDLGHIDGEDWTLWQKADRNEAKKHYKTNEWNEHVVTCEGAKIKVKVNGYTIVEYVATDGRLAPEGVIALQLLARSGPAQVAVKDIRVKELSRSSSPTVSETADRKLLFLTHSAGHEHGVVHRSNPSELSHAERTMVDIGTEAGFDVTCTQDCSLVAADNLEKYDAVMFYTIGTLPIPGPQDLLDYVKAGGGFVGCHCATMTFRDWVENGKKPYLDMVGAEFDAHGPKQEARIIVADRTFPAVAHITGQEFRFNDEWYTYRDMSKDIQPVLILDPTGMQGKAYKGREEFPVAWRRNFGQGRVFYTGMGHDEEVWGNQLFQKHLVAGIKWAMGDD